jgi:multisubunit Na+/H+ antiporter MnhE subunit
MFRAGRFGYCTSVEIAMWWAFLVLVWIATLNTFSLQELLVAAVLAVPCAVAARAGRVAAGVRWRIPSATRRWLLALPAAIAHDAVAVLSLGVRWRTREHDDSFTVVKLPLEDDDARRAGREAMTTAILSATPGSVVVDANGEHDELLVHTMPIGRTRLERELSR